MGEGPQQDCAHTSSLIPQHVTQSSHATHAIGIVSLRIDPGQVLATVSCIIKVREAQGFCCLSRGRQGSMKEWGDGGGGQGLLVELLQH